MSSPDQQTTSEPRPGRPLGRTKKRLVLAALLAAVLGGGFLTAGMALFTPLEQLFILWGVVVGTLGWLVAIWIVLHRAHLRSAGTVLKMFAFTAAGPAILGAGAIIFANGALDPHEVRGYRVTIVDKHVSGTGTKRSLHLTVENWQEGSSARTVSFQLYKPDQFRSVQKGDKVTLVAGRGLFDWWLREIAPHRGRGE